MKLSILTRNLIPSLFMLLLGSIFLIPSTGKICSYYTFRNNAVSVFGTVDKAPPGGGSGFGGRPLVRYEDLEGNVHVFKSRDKTHFFVAPQKGEPIKVLFLINDPRTAIVDSVLHHIYVPLIFSVIGLAVIYLALKNCRAGITTANR
jgi:hypothetical protein